jgi:hypothetical protein
MYQGVRHIGENISARSNVQRRRARFIGGHEVRPPSFLRSATSCCEVKCEADSACLLPPMLPGLSRYPVSAATDTISSGSTFLSIFDHGVDPHLRKMA